MAIAFVTTATSIAATAIAFVTTATSIAATVDSIAVTAIALVIAVATNVRTQVSTSANKGLKPLVLR